MFWHSEEKITPVDPSTPAAVVADISEPTVMHSAGVVCKERDVNDTLLIRAIPSARNVSAHKTNFRIQAMFGASRRYFRTDTV